MKPLLAAFFLTCLCAFGVAAQQQQQRPRFEDYPARVWRGQVAALDTQSHPLARKFRTVLGEQLRESGVNFAGRFTFAGAGCGTGCSVNAVLDARTGRAYFPPALDGWTTIIGDEEGLTSEDLEFGHRADSHLLRLYGRPNIGRPGVERYGPSGIYFYEWTASRRLRLVKFLPRGSYPRADPPARQQRGR